MALHKFLLEIAASVLPPKFSNVERNRIDEWLKANTPRFEAKVDGPKCEMFLNGVIGDDFGGVSAARFEQQLATMPDVKEITLNINSPGGFVDDGLGIYAALVRHPAKVITNVTGQAASAASFVVQAGDERVMGEATSMFLHRAMGLTMGNDIDHEKTASFLKTTTEAIALVYAKRSGRKAETFLKMMSDETLLNAQQALDAKLIDSIAPLKKAPKNEVDEPPIIAPPAKPVVSARAIIDRKLRMMELEAG